jgi:hypothetical protein
MADENKVRGAKSERMAYERPQLRRIGSVSELTLSGGSQVSDGPSTNGPNKTKS